MENNTLSDQTNYKKRFVTPAINLAISIKERMPFLKHDERLTRISELEMAVCTLESNIRLVLNGAAKAERKTAKLELLVNKLNECWLSYDGNNLHNIASKIKALAKDEVAKNNLPKDFVFESLQKLDGHSIQLMLRETSSESLIIAMKGASDELREKIYQNMAKRAAAMLREDVENKSPVKLSEVKSEQKKHLNIVKRLVRNGQICLGVDVLKTHI